jgi:hypothetical protein
MDDRVNEQITEFVRATGQRPGGVATGVGALRMGSALVTANAESHHPAEMRVP